MEIGFIGFGGAAYGICKGLKEAGKVEIHFFDTLTYSESRGGSIRSHAREIGAIPETGISQLIDSSEIIFSCVTGSMALMVAKQAALYLTPHHLFVDVNSASPVTMEHVYNAVRDSGAAAVDVAMMGGIPAFLHRVPCLASGDGVQRLKELFEPLGMDITSIGESFGQASAIKMFRSIFMKGMLALLIEMLNATHQYDVDSIVLDSLRKTMEKNDFLETVRLQVTKGVVNAERMSHEMEAVIQTLGEMDLPSVMASATKDKLEWISGLEMKEYFDYSIPESLDAVLDEMKTRT